jgi:predicted SAM-dependent methyltransferase
MESRLDYLARGLYRNFQRLRQEIAGVDKKIIEQYLGQQKAKKLHLGCGNNIIYGWLNADFFPKSKRVVHIDAMKTYPFDDETFDYIFSEHMIEHVSYAKGQHMLKECFRVLKEGGKIRISTPDLSFLISLYQREKSELQKKYIRWATETFIDSAPYCEDTYVINNFVRDWGHIFIYDEKALRFSLEKAGFKEITKCALNESEDKILRNLENEKRLPEGFLKLESLTLEGIKKVTTRTKNELMRFPFKNFIFLFCIQQFIIIPYKFFNFRSHINRGIQKI